jgi:hypothetical protein
MPPTAQQPAEQRARRRTTRFAHTWLGFLVSLRGKSIRAPPPSVVSNFIASSELTPTKLFSWRATALVNPYPNPNPNPNKFP